MFAAFEYLLMSILELARRARHSVLGGRWGARRVRAVRFFALTMMPHELTTPDLLSGAAMFAAFGALLRLAPVPSTGPRHAVVLGVASALGALAKSFMVPWAVVASSSSRWRAFERPPAAR